MIVSEFATQSGFPDGRSEVDSTRFYSFDPSANGIPPQLLDDLIVEEEAIEFAPEPDSSSTLEQLLVGDFGGLEAELVSFSDEDDLNSAPQYVSWTYVSPALKGYQSFTSSDSNWIVYHVEIPDYEEMSDDEEHDGIASLYEEEPEARVHDEDLVEYMPLDSSGDLAHLRIEDPFLLFEHGVPSHPEFTPRVQETYHTFVAPTIEAVTFQPERYSSFGTLNAQMPLSYTDTVRREVSQEPFRGVSVRPKDTVISNDLPEYVRLGTLPQNTAVALSVENVRYESDALERLGNLLAPYTSNTESNARSYISSIQLPETVRSEKKQYDTKVNARTESFTTALPSISLDALVSPESLEAFITEAKTIEEGFMLAREYQVGLPYGASHILGKEVDPRSALAYIAQMLGDNAMWKMSPSVDKNGNAYQGILLEGIRDQHGQATAKYGEGMGIIALINGEEPGQGSIPLDEVILHPGDTVSLLYKDANAKYGPQGPCFCITPE